MFLSNNNNNEQQKEMFRGDGLDMFMPYIMVVVSWIIHYFQTHQGIYIKYIKVLYVNDNSVKWLKIPKENNKTFKLGIFFF